MLSVPTVDVSIKTCDGPFVARLVYDPDFSTTRLLLSTYLYSLYSDTNIRIRKLYIRCLLNLKRSAYSLESYS